MLLREAKVRQSLKDKQKVCLLKGAEWKVSQMKDFIITLSVLSKYQWAVL